MSAPLSQQLFHATFVDLNPGDTVVPENKLNPKSREDRAYATTDLGYAKRHVGRYKDKEGRSPRVYEVEPSSDMKSFGIPNMPDPQLDHIFISKTGFKVKGQVYPKPRGKKK